MDLLEPVVVDFGHDVREWCAFKQGFEAFQCAYGIFSRKCVAFGDSLSDNSRISEACHMRSDLSDSIKDLYNKKVAMESLGNKLINYALETDKDLVSLVKEEVNTAKDNCFFVYSHALNDYRRLMTTCSELM